MLSDRIWITRKTRIYTEDRLQKHAMTSQILVIVYSLVIVFLSVWNLQTNDQKLNLLLIFASVVVLVLSVFIASQKFTERSITMRNCYIKLDELYSKVKRAEASDDNNTIQQLESEYTGLLINIENHSEYDFLCLRYTLRDNPDTTLPQFTKSDFARFIWEKVWRNILTTIFFAPAVAIVAVVLI